MCRSSVDPRYFCLAGFPVANCGDAILIDITVKPVLGGVSNQRRQVRVFVKVGLVDARLGDLAGDHSDIGDGAGVWGKVRACLLHGAGIAMNLGPELHSRWRAPQLAESLWAGGVVACPAEGVWGLSCDPFDEGAVLDLLAMKQREVSKGLIVVGASSDVFADVLSDLSSEQRETMLASWPGPNTWLVPHKGFFPSWITGDSDEVAIRVTSSPALATLCLAFGGPLVSTSANPAGLPPPHSLWELRRYFGMALPAMPGAIDPTGKPSTIRRVDDGSVIRG